MGTPRRGPMHGDLLGLILSPWLGWARRISTLPRSIRRTRLFSRQAQPVFLVWDTLGTGMSGRLLEVEFPDPGLR